MSKSTGIALIVSGMILDNYAFLYDVHWGPQGGVIVLDSVRYLFAGAGVVVIALGLFILLHWARSISGSESGGRKHASA